MRARIRRYRQFWHRMAQPRKTAELAFRLPMAVTECRDLGTRTAYWVCPQCRMTLERDFQAYCDRCGQCLDWSLLDPY